MFKIECAPRFIKNMQRSRFDEFFHFRTILPNPVDKLAERAYSAAGICTFLQRSTQLANVAAWSYLKKKTRKKNYFAGGLLLGCAIPSTQIENPRARFGVPPIGPLTATRNPDLPEVKWVDWSDMDSRHGCRHVVISM